MSACLACEGPLDRLGAKGDWVYAACRRCGAVQLDPPPRGAELRALYERGYHHDGHYYRDAARHQRERAPVIEQVGGHVLARLPAGGRALELGAGWGNLGLWLRDRGARYLGLEPSTVMRARAVEAGLDVRDVELDALVGERFDVIVSMAVFEHLPDPTETLRQMKSLLTDGGAIVIQAPTAGVPRLVGRLLARLAPARPLPSVFGSLAPPWHVCLPTPRSVRAQAARVGLSVARIEPSRSGRIPGLKGILQGVNEVVAQAGHRALGERWPLSMGHLFVLA